MATQNVINAQDIAAGEAIKIEPLEGEAQHENIVMALRDEYKEPLTNVSTGAFGLLVTGLSEDFTSRTRIPVGMLTEVVDAIGEIVEGAKGLFIRPALIFTTGFVSPGAVIFCTEPVSMQVSDKLNIVIVEFLAKLKRKSNPDYTIEFIDAIREDGLIAFEVAVNKTIENVGGKRLTHDITLLEPKGGRLAIVNGTLQAPHSDLPEPSKREEKYKGILMAHDVSQRKIKIKKGDKMVEISTDFETHHVAITCVLSKLMAEVIVDVVESHRAGEIVGVEMNNIAFDVSCWSANVNDT